MPKNNVGVICRLQYINPLKQELLNWYQGLSREFFSTVVNSRLRVSKIFTKCMYWFKQTRPKNVVVVCRLQYINPLK